MTVPKTPAILAAALALTLRLFAARGYDSRDITLADVSPDITNQALKAGIEPAKPRRLPPQSQVSTGQPY